MWANLDLKEKVLIICAPITLLCLVLAMCSGPSKKDDYVSKCQQFCESVSSDVVYCDKDKKVVVCK